MKLNESVLSSRRAGGFTLAELMIALAIVGFVLLVCYSSSIGLQRGFGYSSAWTEARINQVRVLDSLAVDLRNATRIDFSPPALITLTIPDRYKTYYLNTGGGGLAETFDAAAGDPTYAAIPITAPTPAPGEIISMTKSNITWDDAHSITVTYTSSSDETRISRVWTNGFDVASRDVATFPNGSTVTFTPKPETPITNASDITSITTRIQTSPDYLRPNNPAVLEDTVFLRQISIK